MDMEMEPCLSMSPDEVDQTEEIINTGDTDTRKSTRIAGTITMLVNNADEPMQEEETASSGSATSSTHGNLPISAPDDSSTSKIKNTKKSTKKDGRQRRRKPKKSRLALFTVRETVKVRPAYTLSAQRKFTLTTLKAKFRALKKDSNVCYVERNYQLEKMEETMMTRLEIVSSLKFNDDADDELVEKKYELIKEMERKILMVQEYRRKKQVQMEIERPKLGVDHNEGMFVCCSVCARSLEKY